MKYTDEEQKGIDKVERMNRMFDKFVLPGLGVIVVLLLVSFILGKVREKFILPEEPAFPSASAQAEQDVFARRSALLRGYETHQAAFEAYGYQPVEGYAYAVSLAKTVDEEMTIFQFSDETLGELTIVNYMPKDRKSPYTSLSLAVSSPTLLNVTVKADGKKTTVTFTDTDFTGYQEKDADAFQALMKHTDTDEIKTMYEIFTTDINSLWKLK